MSEVPSNSSMLCAVTLQALAGRGILREVILCAGARNSALVVALAAAPGVRLWHHFEERSAAFFALGRILAHGRPVAVVTTSGTAVAELFPAVIEAHYQGLPLVALTADRPANYRGTGAPQAIEQAGIFGNYPALTLDVRELDDLAPLAEWTRTGPLHVNLCLEEPDAAQIPWLRGYGSCLPTCEAEPPDNSPADPGDPSDQKKPGDLTIPSDKFYESNRPCQPSPPGIGIPPNSAALFDISLAAAPPIPHIPPRQPQPIEAPARHPASPPPLLADAAAFSQPLVLLGDLLPLEIPPVTSFLIQLQAPVYAEAASGLRESPELQALLLPGGDTTLKTVAHHSVIRLGGVPACRFWRDLEDRPHIPVLSLTRSGHRGLARTSQALPLLPDTLDALAATLPKAAFSDFSADETLPGKIPASSRDSNPRYYSSPSTRPVQSALDTCFARHPASEPALVRQLSALIPPDAVLFTGNSMPIREWNLCAHPDIPRHARALRGANGIDGNISAFLGLAADAPEAWCLIGDLTALYDLSAPWLLPQLPFPKIRIVVIQNTGGKIFSRLPALRTLSETERRLMENPHHISLQGWAAQWNLAHLTHHASTDGPFTSLPVPLPDRVVLELHPDSEATETFWRDWAQAGTPPPAPVN